MTKKIAAISLFSGCGGLDIGAHAAGVHVGCAVDFEEDALKSMSLNKQFQGTKLINSDIAAVSSNDLAKAARTSSSQSLIVIGGPPCQPFSKNGYWVGNKNRQSSRDPRNMISEYFRVIREVRPDGFLLENVESILHPSNHEAVSYIQNQIKSLGYHHQLIRANAADYGVPQLRKRVFFIASRNKFKNIAPIKTHGTAEQVKNGEREFVLSGVGEFIKKFASSRYFEEQEVAKGGTYYSDLKSVPAGKNYLVLARKEGSKFKAGKRFWNFLLKLHPELPSWTISAQPGPWVGPFHWDSRRLRVPEIAAIQTFPDGYKFYGSRRSIQRQIGNAVPPALAKQMVSYLTDNI